MSKIISTRKNFDQGHILINLIEIRLDISVSLRSSPTEISSLILIRLHFDDMALDKRAWRCQKGHGAQEKGHGAAPCYFALDLTLLTGHFSSEWDYGTWPLAFPITD